MTSRGRCGSATLAGSWQVGAGSRVGYRVQEILLGQRHTAVGRSSSVAGQMVIKGTTVQTASFTIETYSATGHLTLHGRSVPVTFPLRAERTATGIEVQGSIPVLFSAWGIPNPSFSGFVTTQNHGIMEFLLDFKPA